MAEEISRAILAGRIYEIEEAIQRSLGRGLSAEDCLHAMMAGLEQTGHRFAAGEYFVPELMMAADAFKAAMRLLEPSLKGSPRTFEGTVVVGTVRGDIHDIGKNLVSFMLESAGFEVHDLGVDVASELFIEAVGERKPQVLGLSALLTSTMLGMNDVVEGLEQAGLRQKVKVIVGGAPVSRRFAESIGADAYGSDAGHAVEQVRGLLHGRGTRNP